MHGHLNVKLRKKKKIYTISVFGKLLQFSTKLCYLIIKLSFATQREIITHTMNEL